MDQKCVLALIFANAFEIEKFTKLKDLQLINFCYTVNTVQCICSFILAMQLLGCTIATVSLECCGQAKCSYMCMVEPVCQLESLY